MSQHDPARRHEMVLRERLTSGAEEWWCPSCGRRFMMRWPPDYEKVVLERGDDGAIHTGGKGGVSFEVVDVVPADEAGRPDAGERDWRGWLNDHGIEWDGPAA